MKALVLGAKGMLGSAVARELVNAGIEVKSLSRDSGLILHSETRRINVFELDSLEPNDFIINCVGVTKSRIDESSQMSRDYATVANVLFPKWVAEDAEKREVKVIQVATDCVFSGRLGGYTENDPHDATDVYGKTKSLGEVVSPNVMHLRCSLIGPEIDRSTLLFEWVRNLPKDATVFGYTNHLWNGITSLSFGRITAGIIHHGLHTPGVQHVIPHGLVTKDQLIRKIADGLGRYDLEIISKEDKMAIDRSLGTSKPEMVSNLFYASGYGKVPSIEFLIEEMLREIDSRKIES